MSTALCSACCLMRSMSKTSQIWLWSLFPPGVRKERRVCAGKKSQQHSYQRRCSPFIHTRVSRCCLGSTGSETLSVSTLRRKLPLLMQSHHCGDWLTFQKNTTDKDAEPEHFQSLPRGRRNGLHTVAPKPLRSRRKSPGKSMKNTLHTNTIQASG